MFRAFGRLALPLLTCRKTLGSNLKLSPNRLHEKQLSAPSDAARNNANTPTPPTN